MKYYDQDTAIQLSILSLILEHYNNGDLLYQALSNLHMQQNTSHTVQWDKLSTLWKYGFNGLDRRFEEITHTINIHHQIPILLLYAWLLWLPTLLQSYQGSQIRLFNPKYPSISFLLTKTWHQWIASQNSINNITDKYVFIDDMYATSKSYQQALEGLSSLGHTIQPPIYSAVYINTTNKQF